MDVSRVSHTSILNILPTKISAGLPASRLLSMTVRSKLSSSVWKWKTSWRRRRRQEMVPIRLTQQFQHQHKAYAQMKIETGTWLFKNSPHVVSWKPFEVLWMSYFFLNMSQWISAMCFLIMDEIHLINASVWTQVQPSDLWIWGQCNSD